MYKQDKYSEKKAEFKLGTYTGYVRIGTYIYKKEDIASAISSIVLCDPHGARTHDPNIKSVVLYQLS